MTGIRRTITRVWPIPGLIFILFGLMISGTHSAWAGKESVWFMDGVKAYNHGDYKAAIDNFSRVAASGIVNGKLYYNLGNAYLKDNDLGHAVLWYERAKSLIPNDPDLIFNYNYAVSLVKDAAPAKTGPLAKVLFFWKYHLSKEIIQWTAVILNSLFWVLMILRRRCFRRNKGLNVPTRVVFFFAVIFSFTAIYDYYGAEWNKQAVIIPAQTAVRSGLSDGATRLFVLHSGTKVGVEEEKKEYMKIRFSKGKLGWIKKKDAEIVDNTKIIY